MPVVSYLVYPIPNKRATLLEQLNAHPCCETVPAETDDVFVLVTDTTQESEEAELQEFLRNNPYIECLAMVYGEIETDKE